MPSLKVPLTARMNSASSSSSSKLKFLIGGMVASPTPTVPISVGFDQLDMQVLAK